MNEQRGRHTRRGCSSPQSSSNALTTALRRGAVAADPHDDSSRPAVGSQTHLGVGDFVRECTVRRTQRVPDDAWTPRALTVSASGGTRETDSDVMLADGLAGDGVSHGKDPWTPTKASRGVGG
jgi:hypothetical protein